MKSVWSEENGLKNSRGSSVFQSRLKEMIKQREHYSSLHSSGTKAKTRLLWFFFFPEFLLQQFERMMRMIICYQKTGDVMYKQLKSSLYSHSPYKSLSLCTNTDLWTLMLSFTSFCRIWIFSVHSIKLAHLLLCWQD